MLSFVLLAYDWFLLDAAWAERRRRFLKLGLPLLGRDVPGWSGPCRHPDARRVSRTDRAQLALRV